MEKRSRKKCAIIIGAGPAGLTAAYELLTRTDIQPIILEKSDYVGGISRTACYKGNRIDIGGHRFFSKSDRVMDWWLNILPIESFDGKPTTITYHKKQRIIKTSGVGPDPDKVDEVMLVRKRKSRIYFMRQFFDYPLKFNLSTIKKLGWLRVLRIGASYLYSYMFPVKPEKNLEQFFINRFGQELYQTFFKSYTEKVWGVRCDQISAAWGAQRIKGLSIITALAHFVKQLIKREDDFKQKDTETTLIEQFLYPKYGPGQMWEVVAKKLKKGGGIVYMQQTAQKIFVKNNKVVRLRSIDTQGTSYDYDVDYLFSTMPVKELILALQTDVPIDVRAVSDGLVYRDFITVGLLVDRLVVSDETPFGKKFLSDNWIYIQEPDVLVGRLQIFNNWSPYMVADALKVWIGLEYFCYDTDDLWKKSDDDLIMLAKNEMEKIGIIKKTDVKDATVIRMEKTYPAYFGTYDRFDVIKDYLNQYENLFLLGRNGQHKYNNQDHSMLTAMTAVDNIIAGIANKENVWAVNTEQEYHEEK